MIDVAVIDPPWTYKARGKNDSTPDNVYRGGTMTDQEIADLPVGDLFGQNGVIFLWVVDWKPPKISDFVAESWGFRYATRAWVWIKSKPSGFGFFHGRGYYTMSNPEDCLIYVRGSMPVEDRGILSIIYEPVHQHSRKPSQQFGKIERLYPGMKYAELFARRPWPGWAGWGDELKVSDPEICSVLGTPEPLPLRDGPPVFGKKLE